MNYVLCVDIGLANIGAVVMARSDTAQPDIIIDMAYFSTERSDIKKMWRYADDKARRVQECARFYADLVRKHDIKRYAAELPCGGAPNSQAATDLAYASSALVATMEVLDVVGEWYSEKDVKRAATGRSNASKRQVTEAMDRLYPSAVLEFPHLNKREHVCDAFGVWTAARNGTLVRL